MYRIGHSTIQARTLAGWELPFPYVSCACAFLLTLSFIASLGQCIVQGRNSFSAPTSFKNRMQINLKAQPEAVKEHYVSLSELQEQGQQELNARGIFPKLVQGDPSKKVIALSFDDGPHPGYTEKLLKILKRGRVQATFFVVGKMVDRYPYLIRQEVAAKQQVVNQTYDHVTPPRIPPDAVDSELRYGEVVIKRAAPSYTPTDYCRPPGAQYNTQVTNAARGRRYTIILWTVDPGDFANPGADFILDNTLRNTHNGGIILLHHGVQQTVDVLPKLIHTLRQRPLRIITCAQMDKQPRAIRCGGPTVPPGTSQ